MSRATLRAEHIVRVMAGFGHPISKIAYTTGIDSVTVTRILRNNGPIISVPYIETSDIRSLQYWIGYLHNLPHSQLISTIDRTSVILPKKALPLFQEFIDTCLPVGRGERSLWISERPNDPTTVLVSTENEHLLLAIEHAKAYYGANNRLGTFAPSSACVVSIADPSASYASSSDHPSASYASSSDHPSASYASSSDHPSASYASSSDYWRGAVDACGAVRGLSGSFNPWDVAGAEMAPVPEHLSDLLPRPIPEHLSSLLTPPESYPIVRPIPEHLSITFETDNGLPFANAFIAFVKECLERARNTKVSKTVGTIGKARDRDLQDLQEQGEERHSLVGPGKLVKLVKPPRGKFARVLIKGIAAELIVQQLFGDRNCLSIGTAKEMLLLLNTK